MVKLEDNHSRQVVIEMSDMQPKSVHDPELVEVDIEHRRNDEKQVSCCGVFFLCGVKKK